MIIIVIIIIIIIIIILVYEKGGLGKKSVIEMAAASHVNNSMFSASMSPSGGNRSLLTEMEISDSEKSLNGSRRYIALIIASVTFLLSVRLLVGWFVLGSVTIS